MDYEKKYKEALRQAEEIIKYYKERNRDEAAIEDLQEIFPELKESKDEKIRKTLIEYFNAYPKDYFGGLKKSYILAWLEKQGEERKITHEEICKSYDIPDIGEFSDGYHTFNGLYKQRMVLFAVLVKTYKDRAWKSWKHEDGLDCFGGGWFIVGIDTPAGTYTYHYEAKDWDRFDCQILEKAKHWDGHDESDVERLFSLVSNANKDEVIRCLINGMKFYYEDNEEATWGTEKFSMKVKDILSWLEKQGQNLANSAKTCKDEQNPFDYENAYIQQKDFAPKADMPHYSIGDVLCDKSCTMLNKESQSNFEITDIRNGMYICDKCSFPISQQDEYELVAKRIEQKPADKVETKFKVGDWITIKE